MAIKRQIKSKRVRRGDGPDALAVAAQLREVNAEQHRTINEKLDTIKLVVEKIAEASISQAKDLATQNTILKDHIRRTAILEGEVIKLNKFRQAVTAISAFVVAISGIIVAVLRYVR